MGIHLSMQKLRAKFCQKASREKCALCPPKKHKSRRKVNHTKMCARRKLQKTTLSMVKSRLALIIGGCLFVSLLVCHHAKNGQIHRIMDVDCPQSSHPLVTPLSRPDQTRPGKGNTWSTQSFADLTLGHRCLCYQVQVFRCLVMDLRKHSFFVNNFYRFLTYSGQFFTLLLTFS